MIDKYKLTYISQNCGMKIVFCFHIHTLPICNRSGMETNTALDIYGYFLLLLVYVGSQFSLNHWIVSTQPCSKEMSGS